MTPASEHVLWIDPGDRTGWARAVIEDGAITEVQEGVTPLKEFALGLGKNIHKYDVVGYETFRLREDKAMDLIGNDFQTCQLIGMIRYLAWIHPKIKLVSAAPGVKNYGRMQMPEILSSRLPFSTEEHSKDALDLLSNYWFRRFA